MKTKLIIGLSLISINLFAAANAEFMKGIDFTGVTTLSASQLNQLVDNAKPAANRGLVLVTNGTPDTTTYPYFTNYLWKNISVSPPALMFWNGSAWSSATIGTGAVTTDSLAAGSVTTAKLGTGAVQTINIGTNVVTSDKIADLAVTISKLAANSVSGTNILDNTIGQTKLMANSIAESNIINGAITSNKLSASSVTLDKLASQLTSANILGGTISGTNIAGGTIVQTNLAANSVVSTNVVDGSITRAKIVSTVYTVHAYGAFTSADTTGAVTANFLANCSVAFDSANGFDVTFTTPSTTTNYAVIVSGTYNAARAAIAPIVSARTVNGFKIEIEDYQGSGYAVPTSRTDINFVVIGGH